jgi:hypothetical protein
MDIELTTRLEPSLVPAYLQLEFEASAPYYDFVYQDESEARRAQMILWNARAGEWTPPHGHAIMLGGQFVGLIGGIMAAELKRVRLGATLALGRAGVLSEDRARRMQKAAKAFVQPEGDDFYYGQVGITAAVRKSGMIVDLFELIRGYAEACGARRCVFQADADSPRLIAFYERTEHERIGEGEATDPSTGRRLNYVHFAMDLAKWRRSRDSGEIMPAPLAS